jgi:tripartite ATP-independent transporter DctM subunit
MENTGLLVAFVFVGIVILLATEMWVAVVMGVIGVAMLFFWGGEQAFEILGRVQFNTLNSFILTAIPLFVLSGELVVHGGLAKRLYKGSESLIGWLPGGLFHTNIFSCAIFAAMSGSSIATAATIGTMAIPEMQKRGYDRKWLAGSIVAGGTLGPLIPPSTIMIVYGAYVGESVGKLFIAGIIPGIILAILFMCPLFLATLLNPAIAPKEKYVFSLRDFMGMWPVLCIVLSIMGSIYSGVATPTEAAALGAIMALVFCLIFRTLTWQVLKNSMMAAVVVTSFVSFILVTSQMMTAGFAFMEVPQKVCQAFVSLGFGKLGTYAVISGVYIFLGMFIDAFAMIMLTLPVVFPIIKSMGFDPIWFGVVLVVYLEMACITPPVGINLYVVQGIMKGGSRDVFVGAMPFVLSVLGLIVLLFLYPNLALWLPSQMAKF